MFVTIPGSRVLPHQVPPATPPPCHFNYAATRAGNHSLSKEEVPANFDYCPFVFFGMLFWKW